MRSISIFLLLLGVAAPAFPSDGVLEINQTCAVQTGCFAGDSAGLPVTITVSGSYRLTSNLVVPDASTSGILISDNNVSIDLAGFEIRGPVVCSGTPLICTSWDGTGSGVGSTSHLLSGGTVRNGSIRGMGANGVSLGDQAEVAQVRAQSNALEGISVGANSIVSGSMACMNGNRGINGSSGSTISGNSVCRNRFYGIAAISSTISGNTVSSNESDGIAAGNGSTVRGNTVRSNIGFGLLLFSQSGYAGNVMTGNTAGAVGGAGGINLGNNACDGSTACP